LVLPICPVPPRNPIVAELSFLASYVPAPCFFLSAVHGTSRLVLRSFLMKLVPQPCILMFGRPIKFVFPSSFSLLCQHLSGFLVPVRMAVLRLSNSLPSLFFWPSAVIFFWCPSWYSFYSYPGRGRPLVSHIIGDPPFRTFPLFFSGQRFSQSSPPLPLLLTLLVGLPYRLPFCCRRPALPPRLNFFIKPPLSPSEF